MLMTCQIAVDAALLLLAYTWLGYPALALLLARLRPRAASSDTTALPTSVSVIIAARNEADRLPDKIANLLVMADADAIAEILVGSDGSDDQTTAVVTALPDPRIRVLSFDQRRGKPSVLNDLVAQATGEILLFTDARQHFSLDAWTRLRARFADPAVGVVSGELVFKTDASDSATGQGMDVYWLYEKWIRNNEGRYASVPGATGAIYAMRRSLFERIPAACLLDDVYLPLSAVMAGSRCVFEAGAVAYDTPSKNDRDEQIRKRRTLSGNLQLIKLMPGILNPQRNPIWWQFVSHKLLRLLSPFALACALIANIPLRHHPFFHLTLIAQIVFYTVAIGSQLSRSIGLPPPRWSSVPLMFLSLQKAILLAWFDFFTGRHQVVWTRSETDKG